MKCFSYYSFGFDWQMPITSDVIVADVYPQWAEAMEALGMDQELITEENCIQDWVLANYQ